MQLQWWARLGRLQSPRRSKNVFFTEKDSKSLLQCYKVPLSTAAWNPNNASYPNYSNSKRRNNLKRTWSITTLQALHAQPVIERGNYTNLSCKPSRRSCRSRLCQSNRHGSKLQSFKQFTHILATSFYEISLRSVVGTRLRIITF